MCHLAHETLLKVTDYKTVPQTQNQCNVIQLGMHKSAINSNTRKLSDRQSRNITCIILLPKNRSFFLNDVSSPYNCKSKPESIWGRLGEVSQLCCFCDLHSFIICVNCGEEPCLVWAAFAIQARGLRHEIPLCHYLAWLRARLWQRSNRPAP